MHYTEQSNPKHLGKREKALRRFSFADRAEDGFRLFPTWTTSLVYHARRSTQGADLEAGYLNFFGPAERFTLASDLDRVEVFALPLPLGVIRSRFGVSPRAIRDQEIGIRECCPSLAAVEDELRSQHTVVDVTSTLLSALRKSSERLISDENSDQRRVRTREALRRLRSGERRIGTLAAELGVTERTLHRDLVMETGLSPKGLARILRYQETHQLLRQAKISLVEVALTCGYADQAHMNAECQRMTGLSPVQLRAYPSLSDF